MKNCVEKDANFSAMNEFHDDILATFKSGLKCKTGKIPSTYVDGIKPVSNCT